MRVKEDLPELVLARGLLDGGSGKAAPRAAAPPSALALALRRVPVFVPQSPTELFKSFRWSGYSVWWLFMVGATYFTLLFVPFDMAFSPYGARPPLSPPQRPAPRPPSGCMIQGRFCSFRRPTCLRPLKPSQPSAMPTSCAVLP